MTYFGWYDPDKKKPPRMKLEQAVARYREREGAEPLVCLTSAIDKLELEAPDARFPEPAVRVDAVPHIPRWTFYIGREDTP